MHSKASDWQGGVLMLDRRKFVLAKEYPPEQEDGKFFWGLLCPLNSANLILGPYWLRILTSQALQSATDKP